MTCPPWNIIQWAVGELKICPLEAICVYSSGELLDMATYPNISESWRGVEMEEKTPQRPRNLRSQRQGNREPKRKLLTEILRQKEIQDAEITYVSVPRTREVTGYAQDHTAADDRVVLVFRPLNPNAWVLPPHRQPKLLENSLQISTTVRKCYWQKVLSLIRSKVAKDVGKRIFSCILLVGIRLVQPV